MLETLNGSQNHCAEDLSGRRGLTVEQHRKSQTTASKACDRWRSERGSVTIMTAILLIGLVLVLGLSIDVSRIYMVRSGLQNAADAAALAAARELNSESGGLTDAVTQAQAVALEANKYGLNRQGVTAPDVTISKVEFAADINGTWYADASAAKDVASTIRFVRVTTQAASVSVLLAASALGATHIEQRTAVAGASVGLNSLCGFFPVMVALDNVDPATGALFNLKFTQGTGSNLTLLDQQYAVIQVTGNGSNDLGQNAAGGIPGNFCFRIGDSVGATSSNQNNGPDRLTSGLNTRFDIFPNSNGSPLQPGTYPPDTNINQSITATQYFDKSPLTAPLVNPGQDDRRILVMPIVHTQPLGGTTSPSITRIGAFFVRSQARYDGNCQQAGQICGDLSVEYLGKDFVLGDGSYDPNGGTTSLSKAVLYK